MAFSILQVSIDKNSGLLSAARQVSSPNCDARPAQSDIELVVVHGISLPPGEYGGPWIEQLFTNTLKASDHPYFESIQELRVSAHLLIRRDGELIQFVPFTQRAWHAGVSSWCGRNRCNDFSIGIELEGCDTDAYTDIQYDHLAHVCKALIQTYPEIADTHIVGHCDIAPGRKTDPGESFNWNGFRNRLVNTSNN